MKSDSCTRDIYFDEDLEKIIMLTRERNLIICLEEQTLRKFSEIKEYDIIVSFLNSCDKQIFFILLKRYFDFLKKEKKYDEYILIAENFIILKKECFEKLKKPLLKISDFFDVEFRKIELNNYLNEIIEIIYLKEEDYHNDHMNEDNSNKIIPNDELINHDKKEEKSSKYIEDKNEGDLIKEIEENIREQVNENVNKEDTIEAHTKMEDENKNSEEKVNNLENPEIKKEIIKNNLNKPKLKGRGNFMWISQREIEDEETYELINKLNSMRQIKNQEVEEELNEGINNENKDQKEIIKNNLKFEKEKLLRERNEKLLKNCTEKSKLFKKLKKGFKGSDYDKLFNEFFKRDTQKNSINLIKREDTILPKVDHIFCIYDISLNSSITNENEGNNINNETKITTLKIIYEKLNSILTDNSSLDEKIIKQFDVENIIELQTNKIYIVVCDNRASAEYLFDNFSKKSHDEINFKINYLANSPDKIKMCISEKIGKKVSKPNVAVISRIINSHLKSNFTKQNK